SPKTRRSRSNPFAGGSKASLPPGPRNARPRRLRLLPKMRSRPNHMTSRWTVAASIFLVWCFAMTRVQTTSTGPLPGATGVPEGGGFAAEITCASAECHGPGDANPDALGKLELTGVPANYTPGQKYRLTLKMSHPNAMRWGFEMTVVATQTMKAGGDFAPV